MLQATDGCPYGKVLRSDRGEPSPAEEFPYVDNDAFAHPLSEFVYSVFLINRFFYRLTRGCRKTKNVILNGHACPVKNLKVHTFPLDYT